MRFVAFRRKDGREALGARVDENVLVDLTADGLPDSLDAVLREGESALELARQAAARARHVVRLDEVCVLAPVRAPGKAFAIGLNYVDHAKESNFAPPQYPVIFQRYPSSWVAHDQPLIRPRASTQFDYEAELVAVIGKRGRHISTALLHKPGVGWADVYAQRLERWLC